MNEDVQTIVVGMLYGMPYEKMFDQIRSVHSTEGVIQALNANGGGHREPKIIVLEDE